MPPDKPKGGAPVATRERRPTSLMTTAATSTTNAPIVRGLGTPARGGACPHCRGRHGGDHTGGPATEHAAEILDTARDLATAYAVGYSDGRSAVEAEHAAEWAALAEHIHRLAATPTLAARQLLDRGYAAGEPCPARCGRCSACIRADAVRRHRGDYTGGPVNWEAHA